MATKKRSARKPADAPSRRVRYAVVGLGDIAQEAVLPAFAHAGENSELAALVSDDAVKLRTLGRRYGIQHRFGYDRFEEGLLEAGADAVYIALPNHLHREYTERAAAIGVHVLCEKPMAVTEEDCRAMIEACDRNGVKLMIAYRLHFDEANLRAVELVQNGTLGEPRLFSSVFSQQVEGDNVRVLPRAQGGGSVYDMGVYCINAARYLFQAEPESVVACSATGSDSRFAADGVDEMTTAILRFPGDRIATFTSSFGAAKVSSYRVVGSDGDLQLDPAYGYATEIRHRLTVKGKTRERTFPKHDQFAPELVHFSECVMTGTDPEPDGREGLADVRVIRAIYASADKGGAPVRLPPFEKAERPTLAQAMTKPAVRKPPKPVRAEAPAR